MKANYILLAMVSTAWLFAGCSQDESVEAPAVDEPIEFGTYIGRDAPGQSRASSVNEEYVKTTGFGVFAYYTGPKTFAELTAPTANFMNNQKVMYDNTKTEWTYSPVRYWPNGENDRVSFFAYAPYNQNIALTVKPVTTDGKTTNKPVISYVAYDKTASNPIGQQTDLLYTAPVEDQVKPNINEKIKFEFKHALSRIAFTVKCAVDQVGVGGVLDENTTVTVEKIILSKNKYAEKTGPDDAPADPKGGLYLSGDLNLAVDLDDTDNPTDLWLSTTEDDNVSFVLDPTTLFGGNTLKKAKDGNSTTTLSTSEYTYLMIIPKQFKSANPKVPFNLSIRYKVTTTDPNDNTKVVSEITNYISQGVELDFEAGKAYKFNLVLGLTSVNMTASYTDWSNPTTEYKLDLTKNTADTGGGIAGGGTNP